MDCKRKALQCFPTLQSLPVYDVNPESPNFGDVAHRNR